MLTGVVAVSQVPFGKLAFMPGKLVHSNEVLVLLGDDYFAWRSAAQAGEIVQRRIACTRAWFAAAGVADRCAADLDDKLADAHATRARIANALGLASTVASEHQVRCLCSSTAPWGVS